MMKLQIIAAIALAFTLSGRGHAAETWKVVTPIVSYSAGPGFPNGGDLTDAAATQLSEDVWTPDAKSYLATPTPVQPPLQ